MASDGTDDRTELERLRRDIRRALRYVDGLGELLERVDVRLDEGTLRRGSHAPRSESAVLCAESDAGVATLDVESHANGAVAVSVNGRRSFRLPPKLGALLVILAARVTAADDGLVGWKSRADVAAKLAEHTGRPVDDENLAKTVHKLRKAFERVGENRWLVQTRASDRALRFALRA